MLSLLFSRMKTAVIKVVNATAQIEVEVAISKKCQNTLQVEVENKILKGTK